MSSNSNISPAAVVIAEEFIDAQKRVSDASGRLMPVSGVDVFETACAVEDLMRRGIIVPRPTRSEVTLVARPDGRRSRGNYPDKVVGWQFLGYLNTNGKPVDAPMWVSQYVHLGREDGLPYLKCTASIISKDLNVGDWIVHEPKVGYERRIFILTAAEIRRWYT